jgi:hypothetical protein
MKILRQRNYEERNVIDCGSDGDKQKSTSVSESASFLYFM